MKQKLSLPILTSLVIGNMIGTGIFLLPSSLAGFGTLSLISWIFTTIGAMFLALTLMSLNKRFPHTGGPYVYCREAFGRLAGFVTAYSYYCGNLVSIAGIAVASIGYLGFIYPTFDANNTAYQPYSVFAAELAVIWIFTIINIIGLHTAGIVQMILTIMKIIPLLAIGLIGLGSIHADNLMQFSVAGHTPSIKMLSSAAALTFWAFIGLEAATIPAENTGGHAVIYKATLIGTVITSCVYILCSFVLMGMIPVAQLMKSQFPFAQAGTMLFGAHAAIVIALCAVISGIGALNACILLQGQIVFAAARDRLFPKRFAKLSKNEVPVAGQLLSSTLVSIFLLITMQPSLLQQFNNIALIAAFMVLFTYFLTSLAEIKFQLSEQKSVLKIFRSKATFFAFISIAYSSWMIFSLNSRITLMTAGMLLCCIPIYFLTVREYGAKPA